MLEMKVVVVVCWWWFSSPGLVYGSNYPGCHSAQAVSSERLDRMWICQRTALYTLCPDLLSRPSFDLRLRCQIRDDSSNTRVDHHSRRDTHKQNFRDIELRLAVWPADFRARWPLSPCGQSQYKSKKKKKKLWDLHSFLVTRSHGDCTLKQAKHGLLKCRNDGTLWRSHITAVSAPTCFDFQHAKHIFLILSQCSMFYKHAGIADLLSTRLKIVQQTGRRIWDAYGKILKNY